MKSKFMVKVLKIVKALINFITDIFVPFISLVALMVEAIPFIPAPIRYWVKVGEEIVKKAGLIAEDIEEDLPDDYLSKIRR